MVCIFFNIGAQIESDALFNGDEAVVFTGGFIAVFDDERDSDSECGAEEGVFFGC